MAFKRRSNFRKKTFKKKVFKKKVGRKVSPLKRMVKDVLYRALETKDKVYSAGGSTVLNISSGASWDATVIPVSPQASFLQIDQGVGNGSRVGNKIETKRLTMKGGLYVQPYSASNPLPRPIVVKMWFYYSKENTTVSTSPRLNLFDNNNSTSAMAGNLTDTWRSFNTEQFAVLKTAEFKLGFADYSGTGVNVAAQSYTNNDFALYRKFSFDLTKHIPKHVVFPDTNANPTSRILNCCWQAMYADNVAMLTDTITCRIAYELDYKYKDA